MNREYTTRIVSATGSENPNEFETSETALLGVAGPINGRHVICKSVANSV